MACNAYNVITNMVPQGFFGVLFLLKVDYIFGNSFFKGSLKSFMNGQG